MTKEDLNGNAAYDLIGIGFGPSNMALSIAMEEAEEPGDRGLKRLFLEAKVEQSWHPGMLLEDSLLQINALKDLATVHNPRSRYTFLNYLKEKGRLYEFLNLRDLYPTRMEYNDYVCWVAKELGQWVRFGKEMVSISPVLAVSGEDVEALEVVARDAASGQREEYLTRNVSLALGPQPKVPEGIELKPDGRVFHSHSFMDRKERDFPSPEDSRRFLIVGGAQSGCELFYYLMTRYPRADVTLSIRKFSIKPMDDSDFTNEIFFPQWVDFTYNLPDEKRRAFVNSVRDVNYEVTDKPLIHKIYKALYAQKVEGKDRTRIRQFLDLKSVTESDSGVVAEFEDLIHDRRVTLEADTLILCTGYMWRKEQPVLDQLAPYFQRNSLGEYQARRDYSIASEPPLRPKVYLQSYCEDTHGIKETVLSLSPVRAQDILQSILDARAEPCRRRR